MPLCQTCMTLPPPMVRDSRAIVAVPTIAAEENLYAWARARDLYWEALGSGIVAIDLSGDALTGLADHLATLSGPESAEARVLLQEDAGAFRPLDLLRTDSAAVFVEKVRAEWLGELLRDGGLDTAFQPIFDLRTGVPVAHECLMRGRTGERPSSLAR